MISPSEYEVTNCDEEHDQREGHKLRLSTIFLAFTLSIGGSIKSLETGR